jgi:DNA-binding MarR family transcriptional regulator
VNPAPVAPSPSSLLFDVFALNQAVGRLLDETLRDAPLRPTEYAVSSAIFELEAATPTAVAARLGMRLTTFMDQLRAFERRGFAQRIPHPTDRRSYRVALTAEGLAAHRAANRAFETGYQAFEGELGGDVAAARSALAALRAAADRARSRGAADLAPAADPGAEPVVATPPSVGRAG